MSKERAAEFAESTLRRARAALREGEVGSAAELALEAYDAAAPHARSDRRCGELCAEAGTFLESVGRRQGRAADQPTTFE